MLMAVMRGGAASPFFNTLRVLSQLPQAKYAPKRPVFKVILPSHLSQSMVGASWLSAPATSNTPRSSS